MHTDTALTITRHLDGDGRTVLTLRGEIDIATAGRLRDAVSEQLPRSRGLVLDVTGAVLVDAAGLRALTASQRQAAALGRSPIVLRGVRPLLAKTLHLTGLDHLFAREPALTPTLRHARHAAPGARPPAPAPAPALAAA